MSGKLPLFSTVKQSYSLAWQNRYEYFTISRWWLLVSLPILSLYTWLTWPSARDIVCLPASLGAHSTVNFALFALLPSQIFSMFICSSIAVAWHRLLLRNEHIPANAHYFRADATVRSYFGFLLLTLVPMLPSLLAPSLVSIGNLAMGWLLIFFIILSPFVAIFVITRVSVVLPAKALGNDEITIKDAWSATKGSFWRLFIGTMLCIVPAIFLSFISRASSCDNDLFVALLYVFQLFLTILITTPVALSFLSLSYKHFFTKQ